MKIEEFWKLTMKPGDRIGVWLDRESNLYIEVRATDDGSIRVRCSDGFISIEPEVSNSIIVRHREWASLEVERD